MDIYNAWFDLKAGVSDVEFSDRYGGRQARPLLAAHAM